MRQKAVRCYGLKKVGKRENCQLLHRLVQGLTNYTQEPNLAYSLFLKIKLYWNTAILICLCIVRGCFHTIMAEMNSLNRNHMACRAKDIEYLFLCRTLADPWLKNREVRVEDGKRPGLCLFISVPFIALS